ncbi:hypothetical protein [Marinoscillum furvescens]|uniref:Uncharacterized protein n=1 Tax=Marinoscillum furvescens DSM 4134 TaxID=1122208 RepID=A0A3D9KWM0_MARFU|nr:hypothetical protein [Marinoscillum furvescens]RED91328.1 hypothetical protein C7460_1461 [Marinoscillum furvescens DSM 4134]
MQITKIISYKDAWSDLKSHHSEEFEELQSAVTTYIHDLEAEQQKNEERPNPYEIWENTLFQKGWEIVNRTLYSNTGQRVNIGRLGPVKNGISATISIGSLLIHDLSRWLFQQTTLAIRHGAAKIPIMVVPVSDYQQNMDGRRLHRSTFELYQRQLDMLSPLSHPYQFLILGYSDQFTINGLEVFEIESDPLVDIQTVVDRCIEFPPEYHQAGLNILNFFGTYLREQYPDEDAKVKIEQDGLHVRLIIEKEDGKSEIIEKALHEYELIVTGKETPEKFTQNDKLVLEIKNELRIAKYRIESQQDIINVQAGQIEKLMGIVGEGLANKNPILIDFRPNISSSSSITINKDISATLGTINELKESLPTASAAFLAFHELEGSLEAIEKETNPEKVKKSPAMSKFRRIIETITDGNSDLQNAIKAAESGWEIFKDLSSKYNKIAKWCGLPQVPSIFTK